MKKAVERTLGLTPTREELLQQYFQIRKTRDSVQEDVNNIHSILQNLHELYVMSRGECFLWRYSSLKNMVIATVADYNRMCELRRVRIETYDERTGARNDRKSGSVSKLKGSAMAIVQIQQEVAQWKELNEEMVEERTVEIKRQSEETLVESRRLNAEFFELCKRLDKLSDKSDWAATLCFFSTYRAYKDMVREIFVEDAITARPRVPRL